MWNAMDRQFFFKREKVQMIITIVWRSSLHAQSEETFSCLFQCSTSDIYFRTIYEHANHCAQTPWLFNQSINAGEVSDISYTKVDFSAAKRSLNNKYTLGQHTMWMPVVISQNELMCVRLTVQYKLVHRNQAVSCAINPKESNKCSGVVKNPYERLHWVTDRTEQQGSPGEWVTPAKSLQRL